MSKFRQQHMPVMWHDMTHDDSDVPSKDSPLKEKASLIGRVGLMFLASGAGAFRTRAAMNKLSRGLGVTCNASIGLKAVEYTVIENDETVTNALSNRTTGVNTTKLQYLEMFCDGFAERAGKYSLDGFHNMLDTIENSGSNYKNWQLGLAAGAACSAFAFLLGAGAVEMACTFIAAALGFLVRKIFIKNHITLFANVAIAVLVSCFVYIAMIKSVSTVLSLPTDFRAGYICSILFIIPGFPLITGGIDLAKLDLRSGIERIMYALLVVFVAALSCAFTATIFSFAPNSFIEYEMNYNLKLLLRLIMSFVGVFGFSIIFNSTVKMAATAGAMGACANFVRLLLIDHHMSAGIAAFIGAFMAGLIASFIKRYIGFPRITLTVASIVIMVPGMYMYKGVHFLQAGNFNEGGVWLCKAFLIVVALPLGLVFARILTDKNFAKSS